MASDVNSIVITGTIFDNPKFFGIKASTLTVAHFTLSCNKGVKRFDPKYMFSVVATLKRGELKFITKGARVACTGHITKMDDEGMEKVVVHCRELLPFPIDRS